MPRTVRVISQRLDGTPRDEVTSLLIEEASDHLCVRTPGETPVRGFRGGAWFTEAAPNTATELYFFDRWYNVLHIHEEGPPHFNQWYANVSMPAEFDGETLRWTDLDVDVRCTDAGDLVVLDEDEFESNRARLGVSDDLVDKVYAARDEILRLGALSAAPFDRDWQIARRLPE